MNRLKFIVTLLLALLWLPLTVHCRIEALPGIEFLSCCQHDDAEVEKAPAHHDNDCETDSCATVESGFYKIEDNPTLMPVLALAACILETDLLAQLHSDSTLPFLPVPSAPPELPRLWQFNHRTALPPRAPSCLV